MIRLALVLPLFIGFLPLARPAPAPPPDIIVVVTDDMRAPDWAALPQTRNLLRDATWFPNYIMTTAHCCPSRASMLTGLYVHHHGVYDNTAKGLPGGWTAFRPLERDALPTRMSGYETALIGKYLNEYDGKTRVPGWDVWLPYPGQPSYRLNGGYSTDVQRDQAVDFLRRTTSDPKFLWFAPFAPHAPAEYAPRHASAFPNASGIDRDRLRSLLAVDEAIAAMYAVADPDTVWIIVSDNGYVINEDGFTGKSVPLDGAHRVPALARIPGVAGGTDNRIVANIDVFATVLTAAGQSVPNNDGLAWQDSWHRDEIRIEGWNAWKEGIHYRGVWTTHGIELEVEEKTVKRKDRR